MMHINDISGFLEQLCGRVEKSCDFFTAHVTGTDNTNVLCCLP